MKIAVAKLKETIIHPHITFIVFNIYIMKSVYFGCGICKLDAEQEQILQNTYETPFLRKLQLSKKMLKEVLYARKTALGVGLVKPSTAIETLALKLHIGNKRAKNRIASLLSIIEEL